MHVITHHIADTIYIRFVSQNIRLHLPFLQTHINTWKSLMLDGTPPSCFYGTINRDRLHATLFQRGVAVQRIRRQTGRKILGRPWGLSTTLNPS